MPRDEPRIEDIAAEVQEERDRLDPTDEATPDSAEASSPDEWTAYAHAKLRAAREELRRAGEAGEAEAREAAAAGRGELEELAAHLPEGRAVSPSEREVHGDANLASRVAEMVADLEAALEQDPEG